MINWLKRLFIRTVTEVKLPTVVVLVRDYGVKNQPLWLYCGDSLTVRDFKSNKLVYITYVNESSEYKTLLIDVEGISMMTRVDQIH